MAEPDGKHAGMQEALALAARIGGVAAILLLIAVIVGGEQRPFDGGEKAPAVGAVMLDGTSWDPARFAGRPLVVNIWATWCSPCLVELPHFVAASKKWEGQVGFVGLAADSPPEHVKNMVARFGIPYDVALIDSATQHRWRATALPSTYLVDGGGRIVWSVHGAIDGDVLDEVITSRLGLAVPPSPPG